MDEQAGRRSENNFFPRGWDTQSPMSIVKYVLICKAMGICLVFVNIEVQSKLFNHTYLETSV